jgi:hypothetical protein
MHLGWKVLIPLILFWLLFVSAKELRITYGWNPVIVFGAVVIGAIVGVTLLVAALRAGDRAYQRELEEA